MCCSESVCGPTGECFLFPETASVLSRVEQRNNQLQLSHLSLRLRRHSVAFFDMLNLNLSTPFGRHYTRQSTADSAFSTDWESSVDSGYANGYFCKKNIEEEEAAEEARVRSMLPEDPPHPMLSLHTPSPEVLIHIQPSKKEETDVSRGYHINSDIMVLLEDHINIT